MHFYKIGLVYLPGGPGTLPRIVQLIEIPKPDKNKVIEKKPLYPFNMQVNSAVPERIFFDFAAPNNN